MSSRLNKLLNRILEPDKARDPTPPTSPSSRRLDEGTDGDDSEAAEGFLCPVCMSGFPSGEDLHEHFESAHADDPDGTTPAPQVVCPVCRMKMKTTPELQDHYATHHVATNKRNGDLETLKQEMAELQTTLREEKWYSEDLKREIERLHVTVGSKDSGDKGDVEDVFKQQIKALEENRALMSSEVVLLRKQLAEAVETNMLLKQDKDRVEQKAAAMAGQLANLKEEMDNERSHRTAKEHLLKDMQEQVLQLQAQLQQRPAADDVEVLRQELVQVQTLMDRLTCEREQEKEKLEADFADLRGRYCELEAQKREVEETLRQAPNPRELESLKAVLNESSSGTQQLQSSLQETIQDKLQLESKLLTLEGELDETADLLATQTSISSDLLSKLDAREKENESLQAQLAEEHRRCREHEAMIAQNAQLVKAGESELSNVHSTLNSVREQLEQQLLEKERQLNSANMEMEKKSCSLVEKDAEVESLFRQLDTVQSQFQQQVTECDELKSQLWEKQTKLEEERREKDHRDVKLQELQNDLRQHESTSLRLEAERTELHAKIEAGEGANTAIQQLKHETASLLDKLGQQQVQAEKQTKDGAKKLENLHKLLQETKTQLQGANDKCGKLETNMKTVSVKLGESQERVTKMEADLKTKSEQLHASETAKSSQKTELESQLRNAKMSFDDQAKQLEKLKEQYNKGQGKLSEQVKLVQQLQATVTQEVDRSAALQAKCESLEAAVQEKVNGVSALTKDNKDLKASLENVKTKLVTLEKDFRQKEESSVVQLKTLEEATDKLQQQIHRLEAERMGLLNEKNVFEKQFSELEDILQKKTAEFEEAIGTTRAEKESIEMALADVRSQTQDKVARLSEQIASLVSSGETKQAEIAAKTQELESFAHKVTQLEETKAALEQDAAAAETKMKEQADVMERQVADLAKHVAEAEAASKTVKDLRKQVEDVKAGLQKSEESTQVHQNDLSQLRRTHEDVISKLRGVEKQLRESQTDVAELQTANEGILRDLEESRQNEVALTKSLEDLNQVKSVLGQQMLKLDTEFKKAVDERQSLEVQKASLETELFKNQKALAELEEKHDALATDHSHVQRAIDEERAEHERTVMGLQAARELLIAKRVETQNDLEAAEAALVEEQKRHRETTEKTSGELSFLRRESGQLKHDLKKLEANHEALQQDKEQKEARHEMQMSALNENLTTLRGDLICEQNKVGELEKKLDELSGNKLELEAKLENALDERRALLERCLASEGECEQLRSSTTELRHKLDDALAAVHELGRENQTLQIESAKVTSRKWTEDAEVTNCNLCQKVFSVTIRKHHCRNCGNIFCAECSSRRAAIPSSKKPVRVCDLCFAEMSK